MTLLSIIDGVDCLQPVLSSEAPRRSNTRETLKEMIVADLGDRWATSPYLIVGLPGSIGSTRLLIQYQVRTDKDDLIVYKPIQRPRDSSHALSHSLRFVRETNHSLSNVSSGTQSLQPEQPLRARSLRNLADVSGLSTVFMPGASAGFVIRTATCSPHVVRLRGEFTRWLTGFHSPISGSENGFIYVDSEHRIRVCELPLHTDFSYPWTLRKVPVEEQVDFLTYSTSSGTYVLGTSRNVDFKLPDDDELHPEWRNESLSFFPVVPQSSVKVVSPKTWSVIDSYPLDAAEHVTAVRNVNMEVSENTHERKDLIVVGTAISKGEDIPARGCIYVFDVVEVVPEPGQPETGRKLKLVGKETVKGAVTALSGIGGQGFVLVAQGQKCMVRGLKEDGSLLPVAFMDMQCYVNIAKELKGTGMCILGDAVKGLWFAGYSVGKTPAQFGQTGSRLTL